MKKTSLNDALKDVAAFVRLLSEAPAMPDPSEAEIMFGSIEHPICLGGDLARRYRLCLSRLRSAAPSGEGISCKAVADAFQSAVVMGLDDTERQPPDVLLANGLKHIRTALIGKPRSYLCHFLVTGLAPVGLPVKIGAVEFAVFDAARAQV
jgi:hypothetical protein